MSTTPGLAPLRSWKTKQNSSIDICSSLETLVTCSRTWIEECTGYYKADKTFLEYLQDGTILCELIQCVHQGLIRKINRIRNPFAWRENISFFLAACAKLGLKESQLFSPEDIITTNSSITNHRSPKSSSPGSEWSLRRIALTVCHLALKVQSQQDYTGPHIQLEAELLYPLKSPTKEITSCTDQAISPTFPGLISPTNSFTSIQSSPGSKPRRVESVTNLITETSSTDIQSYAEIVLYLNGSNKEYTTVSSPAPIRLAQSFNKVDHLSKTSKVHRTLSDRTPLTTKIPQNLLQESISDIDIPTFQANSGVELGEIGNSLESFEEYPEYRDYDSTTTPSDASTVIYRELLSSRCSSNLPVPNEDSSQDKDNSLSESYENNSNHALEEDKKSVVESSPVIARDSATRTLIQHITSLEESKSEPSSVVSVEIHNKEANSYTEQDSEGLGSKLEVSVTTKAGILDDPGVREGDSQTDKESRSVEVSLKLESSPQTPLREVKLGTVPLIATNSHSENSVIQNSTTEGRRKDTDPSTYSLIYVAYSEKNSEEVTDIYNSKPSYTVSLESSGYTNCHSDGSSFEPPVDISSRRMDETVHAQHNINHISDSDPVTLNGMRTHGCASNGGPKEIYSMSSGVPHHSLSLTSSDPESPSSYQVSEKLDDYSESNRQHQSFMESALSPLRSKSNLLGTLDLSRVQSDALPQSLHPSTMVVDENSDLDSKNTPSMLLADSHSIDACSIDDVDGSSLTDSPQHLTSPSTVDDPPKDTKSFTTERDKVRNGSLDHSRGRPMSAPNRSASTSGIKSSVLSHNVMEKSGGKREKRKSLDVERQRRVMNIQEGARVALQYSAKRHSTKSDSLPRESRSSSLTHSILSMDSDEDVQSSSNTRIRKFSSPAFKSPLHNARSSSIGGSDGVSTPLNLRHLSIDQTREASLTQMDEIWRQVEAINEFRPSPDRESSDHTSTSLASGGDSGKDTITVTPSLDKNGDGMELHSHEPHGTSQSGVIQQSDIAISILEPLERSTPLRSPPPADGCVAGGMSSTDESLESSLLSPSSAEGRQRRLRNRPTSFSNKDIDSLLDTLKSLSSREEEKEDLKMLEEMLKSNTFKKAKHVHDDMRRLVSGEISTPVHRIVPSAQLMRQHLYHHTEPSSEVGELRELLRLPHIQAILFCHDKVSTHDFYVPDAHFHQSAHDPVDIILSGSVDNFQATRQTVHRNMLMSRDVPSNRKEGATIVYLERTNRPLGCTIYKQDESVFIGKLLKGCDAEASDMLREGDELLEVNGVSVMGQRTDDIIHLMSGDVQPGTTLAFTIIPVHDESYDIDFEPKYIRAHFNYDGSHDNEIPCKTLGLSFQKGDIMELVNQDDPNWWQACKVFDEGAVSLPGLIPSMHLQQQRESMVRSYSYSTSLDSKKGIMGIFSRKKKKKVYYQNTPPSNILGIGDEIPTYEEVIKLEPDPSLCRPIILIGAPGVGRKTLIRKLLNSNPLLYQSVVQHTTRLIRPGEVNGHAYHFVTREEFERDIEQDRFLEYRDVRGHFYGTAFSSIKQIMESGRVPVLDLHPQALKKTRHSGLKPYIVFIASPRLERLQLTRKMGSEKLKRRLGSAIHHTDSDNAHIYTESDLQHLVKESYIIENQYGHYFDWIIVNDDFQVAADMLKEVSRRLESEPQWVPSSWKNF